MDLAELPENLAREVIDGMTDGSLIRTQARLLLGIRGLEVLNKILASEHAHSDSKMSAVKILAEIGDMKPKAAAPGAGSGNNLQINISLPEGARPTPGGFNPTIVQAPVAPTITIDVPSKPAEPPPIDLGAMPAHLRVPDFVLTRDLVGPTLPPLTMPKVPA